MGMGLCGHCGNSHRRHAPECPKWKADYGVKVVRPKTRPWDAVNRANAAASQSRVGRGYLPWVLVRISSIGMMVLRHAHDHQRAQLLAALQQLRASGNRETEYRVMTREEYQARRKNG